PHHGAVPVQTGDMERDLHLVREGHRDGVAVHGVGTPRAGADRVRLPPPRTFDLCHAAALSALCCGHISTRPPPGTPPGHAGSMPMLPRGRQQEAWHSEAPCDPGEDNVLIVVDREV